MPTNLKRYYGLGDLHFLTFSCYGRLPLLRTARARNVVVQALSKIHERYGFTLAGYVVMTEHIHLLVGEPSIATPSLVMKVLKQRVSRDLRMGERNLPTAGLQSLLRNGDEELPRFWQPRFYDFNIYSAKKKREKLEYMHANPVKRGLVNDPGAWIRSSYLFYEKGEPGLTPIDLLCNHVGASGRKDPHVQTRHVGHPVIAYSWPLRHPTLGLRAC
jgi:putative transposase